MKRSHWMTAALFGLAVFAPTAGAAPTPAEPSPLSWVPATAPIVVHANSPETLREHVLAFLKNAVPDQADRAQMHIDQMLNNLPEGRKLRGLAKDGPVFLVFLEFPKPEVFGPEGAPPQAAFVVAVSNYAEFRDNFLTEEERKNLNTADGIDSTTANSHIYFVDRKEYAVLTPTKEAAEAFVKGAPGLDGKLSKAQAAKFLASDLGVYVNLEDVNKQYGDQIKAFQKTVDEQLDQIESALGAAQKSQFEMIKKMIGPLFQAVEDGKTALFTVEVGADGVKLHGDADLRTGTPTADLLKTAKTSPFPDLGRLPAGQVFYSGMELDPTLLKFAGSVLTGLSADPNAKGAKEFQEAFDEWIKAGPSQALGSVTYPVAGVSVMKCSDPDKAAAAAIKMLQAMGTEGGFQNVYLKDKPEIKPNAEKMGNISFTSVHMVWDLDKSMGAAGAQLPDALRTKMVEGMKKLMGDDLNAWIGVGNGTVVQVTGKDWDSAKKALDQFSKGQGGVGDDKAFAAVRKQLPEQASVVMEIDVVQYVGDLLDFITPVLQGSGAPGVPAKFPKAVKDQPGFAGFALTLRPDGAAFDFVAPAETVKLVYQNYISPLLPKD
ncbi:MAG TPA: hypothetical protein VMS17_06085 [Gemmataceae bacterium]|nr:hypothetical protein [Gemmataceae bacterium]